MNPYVGDDLGHLVTVSEDDLKVMGLWTGETMTGTVAINPVKYGATIKISTELLDDWMWPPRDDYETKTFKLDREHGWWMKPDKRFKSGWRPVIEKAVVNPDGSRVVFQSRGLKTWNPGMERPF